MSDAIRLELIVDDKGQATIKNFSSSAQGQLNSLAGTVKDKLGGAFKSLESKVGGVLGSIKNQIFSLKGVIAGLGLGLLAKDLLGTAISFENLKIQLETLTGSSSKAQSALGWITKFAATTPYEVEGVTEAFVRLMAYGIDPTKGTLRVLGDTAAAMNKPLMAAVEMFADAITGEFERLKEFGIRASQAGENVTFTWMQAGQQMSKTVGKSAEEISAALTEILEGRFKGSMGRLSEAFSGMWSNIKDTWTLFEKAIMDSGVFATLKANLSGILTYINQLSETGKLTEWANAIGTGLVGAFQSAVQWVGKLYEAFKSLQWGVASVMEWIENLRTKTLSARATVEDLIARTVGTTEGKMVRGSVNGGETQYISPGLNDLINRSKQAAGDWAGVARDTQRDFEQGAAQWDEFVRKSKEAADAAGTIKDSMDQATDSTRQFFDYLKAESGGDPFVMSPKISMSPPQPWKSGIEEMVSDLNGVGGTVNKIFDASAVATLVTSLTSLSSQMETARWIMNQPGGNLNQSMAERYGRSQELYDLQLEVLRNQVKMSQQAVVAQRSEYNINVSGASASSPTATAASIAAELQRLETRGV